jgi:membrane protein involved in colicin uptake
MSDMEPVATETMKVTAAEVKVTAAKEEVAAAKEEVAAAEKKVAAAKEEVAAAKEEVAAAKEEVAAATTEEHRATGNKILGIALEGLQSAQDGVKSAQKVLDDACDGLVQANRRARTASDEASDQEAGWLLYIIFCMQRFLAQTCFTHFRLAFTGRLCHLRAVSLVLSVSLPALLSVVFAVQSCVSSHDLFSCFSHI